MRIKLKKFSSGISVNMPSSDVVNIRTDSNLTTIIKNDLLYGVGNRPTLPSCFDDESELAVDGVDPLSDMRHDSWHDASVAMNPTFQRTEETIEGGSSDETQISDDTSKDE